MLAIDEARDFIVYGGIMGAGCGDAWGSHSPVLESLGFVYSMSTPLQK